MFAAEIIFVGVLTAGVLIWAWAFKLDLGIKTPTTRGVWPWIVLFVLWCGVVTALDAVGLKKSDDAMLEWMREYSFLQIITSGVVVFPLFEELLFRGALFSALLREWNLKVAIAIPSVIWGLAHIQYNAWYMVAIAGAGVLLAMIRWESRSLYLPLALHAAFNLFVVLTMDLEVPVA